MLLDRARCAADAPGCHTATTPPDPLFLSNLCGNLDKASSFFAPTLHAFFVLVTPLLAVQAQSHILRRGALPKLEMKVNSSSDTVLRVRFSPSSPDRQVCACVRAPVCIAFACQLPISIALVVLFAGSRSQSCRSRPSIAVCKGDAIINSNLPERK